MAMIFYTNNKKTVKFA